MNTSGKRTQIHFGLHGEVCVCIDEQRVLRNPPILGRSLKKMKLSCVIFLENY